MHSSTLSLSRRRGAPRSRLPVLQRHRHAVLQQVGGLAVRALYHEVQPASAAPLHRQAHDRDRAARSRGGGGAAACGCEVRGVGAVLLLLLVALLLGGKGHQHVVQPLVRVL